MYFENCPPFLSGYLRYLMAVKNRSESTIVSVYREIKEFLLFIKRRSTPPLSPEEETDFIQDMAAWTVAELTAEDLDEFVEYLDTTVHNSGPTISKKISGLKGFYDYLIRNQEELGITIGVNPAAGLKGVPYRGSQCRLLSAQEVKAVLRAVNGEAAVRDRAILLLMCTTGLRLNELVKLKHDDYDGDCLMANGRRLTLTEQCKSALDAYLTEFRDEIAQGLHDRTLFISRNYRRRLTPRGIQKALQKHFDAAGVKGTPKDLRFTAATELLSTAKNPHEQAILANYLGYRNPASLKQFALPQSRDNPTLIDGALDKTWLGDLK